jgi:hypothetical protein
VTNSVKLYSEKYGAAVFDNTTRDRYRIGDIRRLGDIIDRSWSSADTSVKLNCMTGIFNSIGITYRPVALGEASKL